MFIKCFACEKSKQGDTKVGYTLKQKYLRSIFFYRGCTTKSKRVWGPLFSSLPMTHSYLQATSSTVTCVLAKTHYFTLYIVNNFEDIIMNTNSPFYVLSNELKKVY